MRKSTTPHAQFFSSLKHLEKRLKLENQPAPPATLSQPPPPPPPPPSGVIEQQDNMKNTQQTDSLGTPIYINDDQSPTATSTNASNLQESDAPQEFLSRSPDFPPTHDSLPHEEVEPREKVDQIQRFDLDDIEQLMQLLQLSDPEGVDAMAGVDDGFYDKIVGVKGPKNGKEVERLERWIKHFLNGEKNEPFRLAHLLLGKAAFLHSGDDGFEGLVFPSTIDEFLQNDPPID